MEGLCESYDEWKHCITVKCRIQLTADFAAKRIAALSNERDSATARFTSLYGDAYRLRVIQWFEQARAELSKGLEGTG